MFKIPSILGANIEISGCRKLRDENQEEEGGGGKGVALVKVEWKDLKSGGRERWMEEEVKGSKGGLD